ncbi:aminotransferase class I/II-fold pyridoxal phosphate-dependent enzyme [Faecalicatena contorta]|uniref:aminotransferase class I/II-fold pyridoxal phosphate-dependent enzyme n=1 Tax=Faecalicatena contorta TaxID=39482 RepID=UPI001F1A5446|nr:aminotransferase class I/II-fold pyridoxal phosphate-dependent enzyme [Faecalicatena contorta]MCF2555797.1 aminotransferase class I/II-fold pyridoxal phosphate-dependent enzyme [Faecalicatena contorta]MCF2679253.1 aminotransferase class I/II-fold pyridoxal phosphate-dependent enzyme [Faecalicatena contorta]
MKPYSQMTKEELKELKKQLEKQFEAVKAKGLKLDMSRGKPSKAQLDLSLGMMDVLHSDSDLMSSDGVDCRNYGVMDGITEARKLLADMSEVPERNILIYGNSSLNVMFDTVSRFMTHGVMGSTPWAKLKKVKFLCPVPGYDRHFAITEFFGIEMINVPLLETGPDMDMVEKLVAEDASIKGIWCVPKYSNPTGVSYSDDTVRRFARLKPAAKDFRIFWDNAYSIHHLYDDKRDIILELLNECVKAGNPDMVLKFISTSKVSFPGSGIAALAASRANLEDAKKYMQFQTIGHDKLNQLRHVRFFNDMQGMYNHMRKHADILRPKFEKVQEVLEKELGGLGIGTWTKPLGGYFISFDSMEGCAKAIVAKAKEAGLIMTKAGATYPYGKDPKDTNIRIAPSFPTVEELGLAAEIFVLSVKLVSVDKLLNA